MKKTFLVFLAIVMVLSLAACGGASKAKTVSKEYLENYKLASEMMFDGAVTAEKCGTLIHDVWYDAINEEYRDTTEKYVREHMKNGSIWPRDFNKALQLLFSDSDFSSDIGEIKNNQEAVLSLMKKLTSPPDEYKTAYGAITDLYNAYTEFTDCVISPSGSLSTYSSAYGEAQTNFLKYYKSVQIYIAD